PQNEAFWECWTTLTALAKDTQRIRLGALASCVLFRPPSLTAKIAAVFDNISEGRLEFGLGAGWFQEEAESNGVAFPQPKTRISQLREALQITRRLWTEESVSFHGKHYSLKGAHCNPKPLQTPHPPIWTGILKCGPSMLKLAATHVDVCNFGMRSNLEPEGFRSVGAQLRRLASSAGRRENDVKISGTRIIVIGESSGEVYEKTHAWKGKGEAEEEFRRLRIVGTPEECVEQVKRYVESGVEYFLCFFPDVVELKSLRLFGKHVIPAIRP
ncbi:MAG: LLM class flavin-dependent oxidoreductase, partial [Candidatus Bathyarchaeia archaeon]